LDPLAPKAPQLPREQERRGSDDAVERDEQVRLGRAHGDVDARRDAAHRDERKQPGPAAEEGRASDREREPHDRGGHQQRPVAFGREVESEQ